MSAPTRRIQVPQEGLPTGDHDESTVSTIDTNYPDRRRWSTGHTLAATIAGIALVGGGGYALGSSGSERAPEPTVDVDPVAEPEPTFNTPEAEQPPTQNDPASPANIPSQTETSGVDVTPEGPVAVAEVEIGPSEYSISAEKFTTPEEVVGAYAALQNRWVMDGVGREAYLEWLDDEGVFISPDERFIEYLKPVSEKYVDGMFIDNWQQDENLSLLVNNYIELHALAIRTNTRTNSGNPEDIEPYERQHEYDLGRVTELSDSSFVAETKLTIVDNRHLNRAGQYFDSPQQATQEIVFEVIDGEWRVAGYNKR